MSPLSPHIRLALPALLAALALTLFTAVAGAQIWVEQGDAGALISTAQHTAGAGPLTTITGVLSTDTDVDLYCIAVTDPLAFSAWLTCTVLTNDDLWLFDAAGFGIARDRGCQASQTKVGAPLVPIAGFYYVAVSGNDASARNGTSDIWAFATPVSGQAAPNGPAAGLPLTGWVGGTANPSAYTIQLVGAAFCDNAVPTSPGSWGRAKLIYR